MISNSDIKYFESLKNGCTSAFAEIYARHNRRIYGLGMSILRDSFIVDTLVQDTFLKLWEKRDRLESPKHLYFFLGLVMKWECYSYYSSPKTKFFRKVLSLDSYDNYQDYMAGYDPLGDKESLELQGRDQEYFDKIKRVLPLLDTESRHLIDLCLKYGFRYKAISEAMGVSINKVSRKVRMAIDDIKTIINQGQTLNSKKAEAEKIQVQGKMTDEQARVLRLRCEMNYTFSAIAAELNLSQKEVHKEFMIAYRLLEAKHQQQLQSA